MAESQDSSSALKVMLRIRPPNDENGRVTINVIDDKTVQTIPPESLKASSKHNVTQVKEFSFTGVHGPSSTQEEVYCSTAAPLVESLVNDGRSGLLFSYGITNAGKTHTILGNDEHPGILPRALESLFEYLSKQEASDTPSPSIVLSYLEIYNENIYDLLAEGGMLKKKEGLRLVDRRGHIEVKDLSRRPIGS
eukprot:CAMPEP_0194716726 /NCGR_PEP_ID=MMETSP0296-20130528/8427_1 /TAXON_ID=39354 /ORGANISM="Heterosigma akashiwo, Strain CCMP2393" /LENGTH=192 /DNA_ID=CAMNT_0039617259 /DNA_START=44 /DNA_END=619 /DNA_ORIENTATION=-